MNYQQKNNYSKNLAGLLIFGPIMGLLSIFLFISILFIIFTGLSFFRIMKLALLNLLVVLPILKFFLMILVIICIVGLFTLLPYGIHQLKKEGKSIKSILNQKMNKIIQYIFSFFAVIILLFSFIYFFHSIQKNKLNIGNDIIIKVEQFKKDHGRFPDSLTEIGIEEKEEGPVYYDKKNSNAYILWYGESLDKSVIYDSEKKKWE